MSEGIEGFVSTYFKTRCVDKEVSEASRKVKDTTN